MPDLRALFRCLPLVAALLFWLPAGAGAAAPADSEGGRGRGGTGSLDSEILLRQPRFVVTGQSVTVTYQLTIKGLAPLRDQLRDGAHMALEGKLRLFQRNLLRPNSELCVAPLAWGLRHDPLTREFVLSDPEGRTSRAPHLDMLLRDALKNLQTTLTPEDPLEDDEEYIVRFDLVLKYASVPPWLERALFFWSWELSPAFSFEHSFTYSEQ